MEFQRESMYPGDKFQDYKFMEKDGWVEGVLVSKWKNKNENLICCFDLVDGGKIKAVGFRDSHYCGLDLIRVGGRARLEFRRAESGRYYLRNVVDLEELPFA